MCVRPYLVRVAWFGYRNQCPERKTISRFRCLSHARDTSRTVTRSQVLVESDRSNPGAVTVTITTHNVNGGSAIVEAT